VRVGGKKARKGQALAAGDVVEVLREPGEAAVVPDPSLEVPVLYADASLLVADKPAGIATHPLRPGELGTAANALAARYPELASVGPPREGGAVHRLDTGTSGLLVF